MSLHVEDGQIAKVTGDKQHPANFGRLCTKGLTSAQALKNPGRMDRAYLRQTRHGAQIPVPIDTALAETANRLRAILDQHGPDAIAFYVSGQMSLEAQYLANKLAKGFIGTNNIDSNSRLCMSSAANGYKLSLGADGPPGSYQDFDKADVFFVAGANMADCHPILFLRLMDRVKSGAKLIVVDPRRTVTAEKADLFLQINPGTDLTLLNGLLHLLVENGHTDPAFIANVTEGWDAMPAFLEDYPPAAVARITGLAEADLRKAAQWIGSAGNWMSCWTMGLNQSTHGTWYTNAICNLHLATGAICRPGSGPFSLTGQPNAMGGREVGYLSHGLPGQRAVTSEADRHFVETLWRIEPGSIRPKPGPDAVTMFNRMRSGAIKAVWIICTNPIASMPNRQNVIAGLQTAELVITQDSFLDTETNSYADIMLPGALWAEAEGVMVNSERNITLMNKAVAPPGDALADWDIIARIARAMGFENFFSYTCAAEIFDEIRGSWNPATGYDIRGMSHQRLGRGSMQWPCPPQAADRNPIRYLATGASQTQNPPLQFPTATGKARFFPRPALPPAECPDQAFAFILNTGRLAHQWHTMTKTGKIATLKKLNPSPFVEIHPEDARRIGIAEGDMVEIRSRRGRAILPGVLTARVLPGSCFTPFHWNDVFGEDLAINAVTSDATDAISHQPALKFCAVALTKVGIIQQPPTPEDAFAPTQNFNVQKTVLAETGAKLSAAPPSITILWASQTGNAETLAARLAATLTTPSNNVAQHCMADYNFCNLGNAGKIILISSTYGDGDPPDNGKTFWEFLNEASAPRLENLSYAVCGLGDSAYDQFCNHGKNLDARFSELGARRFIDRVDCDSDYEPIIADWISKLSKLVPRAGAEQTIIPNVSPQKDPCGKNNPFAAKLLANINLNGPTAGKETRFISMSLQNAGIRYEAGDAVGIWPGNCPDLVDEIVAVSGLQNDAMVTVDKAGHLPLWQALRDNFELTRPSRATLEFIAERSANPGLKSMLSNEHHEALKTWLWGKQLADVLAAFPIRTPAQDFVAALKPIQPRLYSISSSPAAHPGEIHATVAAVRYGAKPRKGACSTFLADRAGDQTIPIFIQPAAHFRLPADPATPILMIGPGTGVAPFRAFLHERRANGATGKNWLFFGERHHATDFYYRDELTAMRRDGFLTDLSLAFSRDQTEKIYVQHRLVERGADVWSWLRDGAYIYVCGDASLMAKDVDAALTTVVQQQGGFSAETARDYLRSLAREKRYRRDVY